jgi:nicotinamidase-related amidase
MSVQSPHSRYKMSRERAALLVIDVQERLCAAMEPKALERVVNRTVAAVQGAKALGLPVVVTEQYPKGLGHTLPAVAAALGGDVRPVEKVSFSCAVDEVFSLLGGRTQVMVTGMETHVCVFQTVRDLAERGLVPYLCADAAISRTEEDRRIGLDLCRESGAVITTVEAALFDLLGKAGTPEFKAVSAAVK